MNAKNATVGRLPIFLVLLFSAAAAIPFLIPGGGPLELVAFAPLFLLDAIFLKSGRRRCWHWFFIAFLLFNTLATFWVWNVSNAGAVFAIIANSLQMSAIFGLFRFVRRKASENGWDSGFRALLPYILFIATWIAWEWVYCRIELSWPWLVLGNAFATSLRLIQWYEITGATGGSLWALLCSWLLFRLITAIQGSGWGRRALRGAAALLAVVLIPSLCSLVRYYSYREKGEPVEVLALQPNVDPFLKFGEIPQPRLDSALLALVQRGITPDTRYVVTPETFTYNIDLDNPAGNGSIAAYREFFDNYPQTDLVLGALTLKYYRGRTRPTRTSRLMSGTWYDVYNTALIDAGERGLQFYHKSKLVPGVEVIPRPFTFLAPVVKKFGGASDSYGTMEKMRALEGGDGHRIGVMICYESVYGDYSSGVVRDGADLLAVITNDGWWGDTPGYRQHFRYASLRAIENRRDVVQAANTGITGFVNQRGDVLEKTSWWVEDYRRCTMHANPETTFFSRNGDLTGLFMALAAPLLLLLALALLRADRRSARGKSGAGNS